ncbi:MAG: hypothetical protein J6B24_09710 [Clostridia bacterium]|nr:hypothetical protein [Clostridia bacterium]
MKLYLFIIGVSMTIIAGINIACGVASPLYAAMAVVFCVVLQIILDSLAALAIRLTPDRLYPAESPRYRVRSWEKKLYLKLGVRVWKDHIPDLGGIGGFSKRRLQAPDDPAYIEKYVIECHKGVLTHRLCYPLGILVMLTLPGVCALTIALPVAVINLILNALPTMALRYNTPMLLGMLKRMKRKQSGAETKERAEAAV